MTAMTITILVGIEMIIMLFLLMVMVGQVFAGFEPNMPRVATASGGGGGQQDVQQKSIVRSASAVSLTAGRAKVRQDAQENATNTFHLIKISCDIEDFVRRSSSMQTAPDTFDRANRYSCIIL